MRQGARLDLDSASSRSSAVSTSEAVTARARFLEHLAATANVTASAKVAGIHWDTAYNWREKDPLFAAAWANALQTRVDEIEQGLMDYAAVVGHVDPKEANAAVRAAEIVLKAHKRDLYGDKLDITQRTTLRIVIDEPAPLPTIIDVAPEPDR